MELIIKYVRKSCSTRFCIGCYIYRYIEIFRYIDIYIHMYNKVCFTKVEFVAIVEKIKSELEFDISVC